MNDHDRDNLRFLMTASPETLKDWFEKMDQDDILYAFELLEKFDRELDERNLLLDIEEKLEKRIPGAGMYPEAQAVLSKFRL